VAFGLAEARHAAMEARARAGERHAHACAEQWRGSRRRILEFCEEWDSICADVVLRSIGIVGPPIVLLQGNPLIIS
jgi:hypothetical protein